MKPIQILGIAGSLRDDSYNKAALRAAQALTPDDAVLEIFDIQDIPIFDPDNEMNPLRIVRTLKQKIKAADAIVFATPEYNYSIPGALKNAVDWASRPYGQNAWEGKPVAIMSASSGMLGGARAQYQLRQVFVFLNMYPLNRPEVMIPTAAEKFDNEGNLIDQHTKDKIHDLLVSLVDWTLQLKHETSVVPSQRGTTPQYGFKGGESNR